MATRRYSHSQLLDLGTGYHKPGGTLGNHHLEIKVMPSGTVRARGVEIPRGYDDQAARLIVNYSGPKITPRSKWAIVREGDTLGYNCGDVWVEIPASQISDPLLRVMREKGLPMSLIQWVDFINPEEEESLEGKALPGCVTFYKGDYMTINTPKFQAWAMAYLSGPIDQRYKWSGFKVLKGTPREEVAKMVKTAVESGYSLNTAQFLRAMLG